MNNLSKKSHSNKEVDDQAEVAPAQFCTQCVQNLFFWEYLGESNHVGEIPRRESRTELLHQFRRQRRQNLLSVPGSFSLQDVLANASTDAPVKQDQSGVDLPRHYDHYRYVLMQSLPLFVSPWQKFCCKFLPEVCTFKKPKSGVYYNYK